MTELETPHLYLSILNTYLLKKTPTMPSLKTIKTKIKSTGNLKIAHDQNKSITKKSFISMYLSSIQKNN